MQPKNMHRLMCMENYKEIYDFKHILIIQRTGMRGKDLKEANDKRAETTDLQYSIYSYNILHRKCIIVKT